MITALIIIAVLIMVKVQERREREKEKGVNGVKHMDAAHTPRKDAKASPMEGGRGKMLFMWGGGTRMGGLSETAESGGRNCLLAVWSHGPRRRRMSGTATPDTFPQKQEKLFRRKGAGGKMG